MKNSKMRIGGVHLMAVMALAVISLAGCRQEEQGRVIEYKQGVFMGHNPSKPLSENDLAALRERTRDQAGAGVTGGPGQATIPDDVRPPENAVKNATPAKGN